MVPRSVALKTPLQKIRSPQRFVMTAPEMAAYVEVTALSSRYRKRLTMRVVSSIPDCDSSRCLLRF